MSAYRNRPSQTDTPAIKSRACRNLSAWLGLDDETGIILQPAIFADDRELLGHKAQEQRYRIYIRSVKLREEAFAGLAKSQGRKFWRNAFALAMPPVIGTLGGCLAAAQARDDQTAFYALGYAGATVAFSFVVFNIAGIQELDLAVLGRRHCAAAKAAGVPADFDPATLRQEQFSHQVIPPLRPLFHSVGNFCDWLFNTPIAD